MEGTYQLIACLLQRMTSPSSSRTIEQDQPVDTRDTREWVMGFIRVASNVNPDLYPYHPGLPDPRLAKSGSTGTISLSL